MTKKPGREEPALNPIAGSLQKIRGPVKTEVITVANNKGGVAKTTTTLSLASCFNRMGFKVLVIDMDPQMNASITLGRNHPAEVPVKIEDVLLRRDINIGSAIHEETRVPGVHLIYSGIDLDEVPIKLVHSVQPALTLQQKMKPLMGVYDIILIDTPPSTNMLTINALAAATRIIIPVKSGSQHAMYGLNNLRLRVEEVKAMLKPELELLGVLLVEHDRRKSIHRILENQVREQFGQLFDVQVSNSVKVQDAEAVHQTVMEYDRKSHPAKEYFAVAKEIVARLDLKPSEPADMEAA